MKRGQRPLFLWAIDQIAIAMNDGKLYIFANEGANRSIKVKRKIVRPLSSISLALGLGAILGVTASAAAVAEALSEKELAAIVTIILGGADTETDSDGDGIPDIEDAFPDNPKENKDSDRDGVGDNSDVFPYDATKSNSVVINFAGGNVSSIALNTDAVSLGAGNARLYGALEADETGDNTNIIAYDENGNEVEDAVETSNTLFVAESVLSPDGETLFLLTSPHMQRALNLPPEVCSLYRVTLASEAVECLIAAAGDVQPKILNSRAIYSASRKGVDFRADGAAVLYALNYERELPDGIGGGTQSGYAWYMSPDGELTGIDPTENFFIWDALWLDDTRIALLEWEYFELGGDEQYWRIYDTATQSNAPGSPINANDSSSAARGPLGLLVPGEVITKSNLSGLSRDGEERVIEDSRGNFFGLAGGYFRQIDRDGASYTGLEIEAVQEGADSPNWDKQSGTGTDVKYSQVSSDDTFFAHTKGLLPRTPITSIEGQNWESGSLEIEYDNGNVTINFGSSATNDWWGVFAQEPVNEDITVNYQVATGEGVTAPAPDTAVDCDDPNWPSEQQIHDAAARFTFLPEASCGYFHWNLGTFLPNDEIRVRVNGGEPLPENMVVGLSQGDEVTVEYSGNWRDDGTNGEEAPQITAYFHSQAANEPPTDSFEVGYSLMFTAATPVESRALVIPANAINAWLAYDGAEPPSCYANMETCLTWANPEPFEEGFCLHKYGTDPSQDRCVQFNQADEAKFAYKVLRTDMESQRQKRFDDAEVYPNQSGNAFPGVQTIALIDGRVQAYFKDSRDHKYYLAVADANSFWANGESALLFASAQNGSGDNVIITEATSLTLPSPLALDGVAVSAEQDGGNVTVSITLPDITETQGYEFNLFADTPVVRVSPLNSSAVLTQATAPVVSAPDTLTVQYSAEDMVSGDIYVAEMPNYFLVNGSVRRRTPGSQLLFVAP